MDFQFDQSRGDLDWIEGDENTPSAATNADLQIRNTGSAAADADPDALQSGQLSDRAAEKSGQQLDEKALQSGQLSGEGPTWKPSSLRRRTCENATREAIFEHVPAAREDEVLFRWCVFSLWTSWYDEHEKLPVLPNEALLWMCAEADTGQEVLEHLRGHLDIDILPHIPNRRCRLIADDALPRELRKVVDEDLETSASEYDNRVYILSGRAYSSERVAEKRPQPGGPTGRAAQGAVCGLAEDVRAAELGLRQGSPLLKPDREND